MQWEVKKKQRKAARSGLIKCIGMDFGIATEGFRYAFSSGADFICVGMYDFHIVDDVNIALVVLSGELHRKRPWMV